MGWFKIRKGVGQGYMLSPCSFNLHAEYILQNSGIESNVCQSKHCQEKIYGFMEAGLRFDNDQQQKIPKRSSDGHGTEGNGDPELHRLQARDPNQFQHRVHENYAIELGHVWFELSSLESLIQDGGFCWVSFLFYLGSYHQWLNVVSNGILTHILIFFDVAVKFGCDVHRVSLNNLFWIFFLFSFFLLCIQIDINTYTHLEAYKYNIHYRERKLSVRPKIRAFVPRRKNRATQ